MGKKSRDKGARVERLFVNKLKGQGVEAERVPLSGACHGSFGGDIKITTEQEKTLLAEVKARKNGAGFKTLEGWLGSNDLLFLKRDNQEPIVVMEWETFISFLTKEGGEGRGAGHKKDERGSQ